MIVIFNFSELLWFVVDTTMLLFSLLLLEYIIFSIGG